MKLAKLFTKYENKIGKQKDELKKLRPAVKWLEKDRDKAWAETEELKLQLDQLQNKPIQSQLEHKIQELTKEYAMFVQNANDKIQELKTKINDYENGIS